MSLFGKKSSHGYKHTTTENPHYRIITAEQPLSIAAESYRRIKTSLEFANVDKHIQVVQICSGMQGEGKSITVLNLAATYAEDGKKVIVVDLDFRRPKLHRSFRQENKNGITDVLAGHLTLEEAIIHGENGIDCLNRGTKAPYPTALLGSDGMAQVFETLKSQYEYIIVDCPPILAVSDAAIVSRLCDGCLFVISQSKTEKAAAKESVKILRDNGVNVLGVIFTNISAKRGNYYYSNKYKYYYQNYYGKDTKPSDNKQPLGNQVGTLDGDEENKEAPAEEPKEEQQENK